MRPCGRRLAWAPPHDSQDFSSCTELLTTLRGMKRTSRLLTAAVALLALLAAACSKTSDRQPPPAASGGAEANPFLAASTLLPGADLAATSVVTVLPLGAVLVAAVVEQALRGLRPLGARRVAVAVVVVEAAVLVAASAAARWPSPSWKKARSRAALGWRTRSPSGWAARSIATGFVAGCGPCSLNWRAKPPARSLLVCCWSPPVRMRPAEAPRN